LLIGGFLAAFIILLGFFNATKPRILVLHSASPDSAWAQQVDRGMREALARNRRPLTVERYYLGLDSPASAARTGEMQAQARRAIARLNPDILIAVDDEANSLVAREYVGRERPRILYVSLNRSPSDFGYQGAANVSGIAERLPLAAVRDAMADLFRDARRLCRSGGSTMKPAAPKWPRRETSIGVPFRWRGRPWLPQPSSGAISSHRILRMLCWSSARTIYPLRMGAL
ncbi:MAG: hypothetical protein ACKOKC_00700, partial [Chthoniobacterales bacterium]